MPTEIAEIVKYRTPLRQAQRDLTRSRIKNAARDLFYEHHYDTTTMDEIAVAAGLRRSTLYLHYKDKIEILAEVIADYTPKAKSALARLPGPKPTIQQLLDWMGEVTKVVIEERVPLWIIMELRRNNAHKSALDNLTLELLAGLGMNNPRFRKAAEDGASPLERARALILLQEITFACETSQDDLDNALGQALLEVTAQDLQAFLTTDS